MSFFARCIAGGFASLLRIGGVDVVYTRGEDIEEPLRLLPVTQTNPQETQHGLHRGWTERAWQGLLSHLDDVDLGRPQPGDRITRETDAGTEIYEVISDRDQCWQPVAGSLDVYQVETLRIQ
jgi:hypothetical protein